MNRFAGEAHVIVPNRVGLRRIGFHFGVDRALNQCDPGRRTRRRFARAKMAVSERGRHRRGQRHDRPNRNSPAAERKHAGNARRDQHHDAADAVAADHVRRLDDGGPTRLRVFQAPHREAAEDVALRQFQPDPNDRGRHNQRHAQPMHRNSRQVRRTAGCRKPNKTTAPPSRCSSPRYGNRSQCNTPIQKTNPASQIAR